MYIFDAYKVFICRGHGHTFFFLAGGEEYHAFQKRPCYKLTVRERAGHKVYSLDPCTSLDRFLVVVKQHSTRKEKQSSFCKGIIVDG